MSDEIKSLIGKERDEYSDEEEYMGDSEKLWSKRGKRTSNTWSPLAWGIVSVSIVAWGLLEIGTYSDGINAAASFSDGNAELRFSAEK